MFHERLQLMSFDITLKEYVSFDVHKWIMQGVTCINRKSPRLNLELFSGYPKSLFCAAVH